MTQVKEDYTQEVSRQHKCLIVFLLDQSKSMEDRHPNSDNELQQELADAINALLQNMVLRAQGDSGVKDCMDVAVIGYCTDDKANAIIESPFNDAIKAKMDGGEVVSIVEIAECAEIEKRMQTVVDDETGEVFENEVDTPIWIKPKAQFGTPMCFALSKAEEIVEAWIGKDENADSFPPIIVNISDGETTDGGNPVDYANSLKEYATSNGKCLLFNCHLSATADDPFEYPSTQELLPNDEAKALYEMSSILPPPIFKSALAEGFALQNNARGMVFNADMVSLIKFLDIGTRAALR